MEALLVPKGLPPSGTLSYRDAYGVVYDMEWTTFRGQLDITTVTREPRRWGRAPGKASFTSGVFSVTGIVTTRRQLIDLTGAEPVVASEGVTQDLGLVPLNFGCNEKNNDPFEYHLDNVVQDPVAMIGTNGPRWGDPDKVGSVDSTTTWNNLRWIDVWDN